MVRESDPEPEPKLFAVLDRDYSSNGDRQSRVQARASAAGRKLTVACVPANALAAVEVLAAISPPTRRGPNRRIQTKAHEGDCRMQIHSA